jgi:hypothetical protein
MAKITDPEGIRTPVLAVKGLCPRPLDDGAASPISDIYRIVESRGRAVKLSGALAATRLFLQ